MKNFSKKNNMEIKNEGGKKSEKIISSKLSGKTITIILIITGSFVGWELGLQAYLRYMPYFANQEEEKTLDLIMKPYQEDFTGGDTPKETVNLFIAAVRAGDYDLASKYYVIKEQNSARLKMMGFSKETMDGMVAGLEKMTASGFEEKQGESMLLSAYDIAAGGEVKTIPIGFRKNMNNKWKILEDL